MDMAKKSNDRHREGLETITIWEDSEFKARLKREVAASGLPNWTLSDQIRFELRDRRGEWNEPYRPASASSPSRKK